jgi:hypothetical protein
MGEAAFCVQGRCFTTSESKPFWREFRFYYILGLAGLAEKKQAFGGLNAISVQYVLKITGGRVSPRRTRKAAH